MIESSRGYQESSSPSRDLMAGYDMARDTRERPPEVRRYLENLRPQILELQRKLRLQTDEDIAGLESRVDIDMNEVERLTGLIKAFRKAWNENAISYEKMLRAEDEAAFRQVGPALRGLESVYAEIDRELKDALDPDAEAMLGVAYGLARAGEPKLAWKCYDHIGKTITQPDGSRPKFRPSVELPILTAIWDGYQKARETSPVAIRDFANVRITPAMQAKDAESPLHASLRQLEIVRALRNAAFIPAATIEAAKIEVPSIRLKALLFATDPTSPEVQRERAKFSTYTLKEEMACLSLLGEDEKALKVFQNYPTDFGARAAAAEILARTGRTEEAFAIPQDPENDLMVGPIVGKLAIGFLRGGDLESARRALESHRDFLWLVESDDMVAIAWELLMRQERDLARTVVSAFGSSQNGFIHARAEESLARIACAFAETGIDAGWVIRLIERNASPDNKAAAQTTRRLALQARAEVALRTFKRAASRHGLRWSSDRGKFVREDWEEKVGDELKGSAGTVKSMTYAEPHEI